MHYAEDGEEEKKPGSQGHYGVGLKGEKQFPEKMRSFKIINKGNDPYNDRKGCNIGSDPGDRFISFSSKKIGRGRYDESSCTQSSCEKVNRHNPVPMNMYHPFHI
jgi:hypothetical protein